jgi:aspartate-semialdehyde dehydrogenase
MKQQFNIAIVGASGLVGRKMLEILEERNFPVGNLSLFASKNSAGTELKFKDETIKIKELNENSFRDIDIALFSAGKYISEKFAPIATANGTVVIDNGSFWRMHKNVPLIVPEVNPEAATNHHGIIANPNCSTIQLVVALKPIVEIYGLKRVVVSTYQSISGAGQSGINQLAEEIIGNKPAKKVSSHPVAFNTVFHNASGNSGFTEEELKMINEPRKILSLPGLKIAVTCVRLPILGGHGESINIETNKPFDITELRNLLSASAGISIIDDPKNDKYPTPIQTQENDDVFIGRLRQDNTVENGFNMWVVADNIRKGAATNTVQIAELIVHNNLLDFDYTTFGK